MGLFEFIMVTVGIVLSLGITHLLGGVARVLQSDLKSSKLHALWIVMTFQVQLQLAWGLWGLRTRLAWRYPEFVLLLMGPVVLYLVAVVLFPKSGCEPADLHLLKQRRPFFLLNASYVVITGLYGGFLAGDGWANGNIIRAFVIALFVTLAITTNRVVQWAFGLLASRRPAGLDVRVCVRGGNAGTLIGRGPAERPHHDRPDAGHIHRVHGRHLGDRGRLAWRVRVEIKGTHVAQTRLNLIVFQELRGEETVLSARWRTQRTHVAC